MHTYIVPYINTYDTFRGACSKDNENFDHYNAALRV